MSCRDPHAMLQRSPRREVAVRQEVPSSRAPHRAMLQLLTALAAVAACLAASERWRSALAALLRTLAGLVSACKGACAAVPHLTVFSNTAGCGRAPTQAVCACSRAMAFLHDNSRR